jgi:hypothetical protein
MQARFLPTWLVVDIKMFFEQARPDIQNRPAFPLKLGQHQTAIIEFLRDTLPEVANSLLRNRTSKLPTLDEDDITREISNLLNDRLRPSARSYLFRFEAKTGPDILMFASPYEPFSKPLLLIEAKRLPPTSNRDYVRTGIGRFKTEDHGKDHDSAAMLGYIQARSFEYWHNTINEWIDDLIADPTQVPPWEINDKLTSRAGASIPEYASTHHRKHLGPITICDLWLDFTSD